MSSESVMVEMPSSLGPVAVEICPDDRVVLRASKSRTLTLVKVRGRWSLKTITVSTVKAAEDAALLLIEFNAWARHHSNLFRMVALLKKLENK